MKTITLFFMLVTLSVANCFAQTETPAGRFLSAGSVAPIKPGDTGQASRPGAITSGQSFAPLLAPPGGPGSPSLAEASTPEIQALARGLENDPTRIYNYVHDHIRHVFYFGSKKGAQLTLLERSGNDFDQCALLVSLLQSAGYTNVGYQFGLLQIPYDSTNQYDFHHWLGLSLLNTNWPNTSNYISYLFGQRGYWVWSDIGDNNTIALQRVWVTLTNGATVYYLDPAFKISQPITGINLASAMGLNTNNFMTNAGGTDTANYVQGLNEAGVRTNLLAYTTNLLSYINTNYPNATVQQITGGQQIVSTAGTPLSQSLPFTIYTDGGVYPVLNWTAQPTNFMSTLTVSVGGTNQFWYTPQLQGQRLSLTFSNNGTAQLWLEDSLVLKTTNTGTGKSTTVTLSGTHPYGGWDTINNIPIDSGEADFNVGNSYQRTNSNYAILYAYEASPQWLQEREKKLDAYRVQGFADSSTQVVNETLNVMGLNWMVQTELNEELLGQQWGQLVQHHHRLGRMGQESGSGYYVDVYLQRYGIFPNSGYNAADITRQSQTFDVGAYFDSGMEHGIIEQLQSSNLLGASTIKILEIASTNSQKIYLATNSNWTTGANVRGSLTNYGSTLATLDAMIAANYTLLLPQNGSNHISTTGNWAGDGFVKVLATTTNRDMGMIIGGSYFGGYAPDSGDVVSPPATTDNSSAQSTYNNPASALTASSTAGDPVNMPDCTFQINTTDLTLGQTEPRGISFGRFYSTAYRNQKMAGMSYGWVHNYCIQASPTSAPEASLGQTTPQQMVPMLVATCTALNLYNNATPDPKNWMVTSLIAKWAIDQITSNSVSIMMGKDTIQFVKQPNGSFTPPANCTMTLTNTAGHYVLQERHGRTFNFGSGSHLTNIVDQYNQSLNLTYNASNWVSTVKDWKNRQLTFNYTSSSAWLTSVTNDGTGRSVSFVYTTNVLGHFDLTSATDAQGKTTTFCYDTNHQMLATSNALGQLVVTNIYDSFGRVMTQYTTGNTNRTWQVYYSGFDNIAVDPMGGQQEYLYDDKSRQIGFIDALSNLSQTFYDGQDHVVMALSPLNETNQSIYDGNNNLLYTVDALGFTNTLVYNAQNNLIQTIDARGNTNSMGYNSKFQLTGLTNGTGDWVTNNYDTTYGLLATRTDSGGTTSYSYDSFGKLQITTYPGSLGSEGFLNSTNGDVLSHTNGRGNVTSYSYNQRRQLTNSIAVASLTNKIAYDAMGNVSTMTDARGFTTSNTWSATSHLLATTFPATPQGTPVTTNIYDARDWLASTRNPLQQTTQYTNDLAHRLIALIDPLLRTNTFAYDADSRRTNATDAASELTQQQWNSRGELLVLTDQAGKPIGYGRDGAGNQILLTNRNGNVWQFQFDAANRLTNTISPLSKQTSRVWNNRGLLQSATDANSQTTSFGYDARARTTSLNDVLGTNIFQYDANNNLTNLIQTNSLLGNQSLGRKYDAFDRLTNYTDAAGNLIQYRYDLNGNVTNLIYPGSRTVTYAYDSLNRLTNVVDWAGRKTTIAYDLANEVTNITRPNGTSRSIAYDSAGQTTNFFERSAATAVAFYTLGWNAAARVQTEFIAPLPHPYTPPARMMLFDADNRLTNFNSLAVINDNNGNMTSGPFTNGTLSTYSYDARNRLSSAGGLEYAYDPANNRVAVTNGATTSQFVISPNGSQVLMRFKSGVTSYYVYGLGLLYEVDETATTTNTATYHYDCRGSTVALTDGNGNISDRIEYSAYGTITYRVGTNDTPFLYNGCYGVQTDANGLLYMRARYYNPYICRFINADPSRFAGGLNFYTYADGNPISMLDPFGLFSWGKIAQGSVEVTIGVLATVGAALAEAPSGGAITLAIPTIFLGITHGMTAIGVGLQSTPTTEEQESFLSVYPSNPGQLIGLSGYAVSPSFGQKTETIGGLLFDYGSLAHSEFEVIDSFTKAEPMALPLAQFGTDTADAFSLTLEALQTTFGHENGTGNYLTLGPANVPGNLPVQGASKPPK